MATKKQRRRRAKEQRHEWEYVEIDPETGEEHTLEPAEVKGGKRDEPKKPTTAASGRWTGRVVQPPSWNRVLKRGLIFAPLMFITVTLLGSKLTPAQHVAQTVMLLAFFLPFSYVMDAISYRMYLKRTGRAPQPKAKKS
jgi:hypothetical protein